jgi:hypothetical protein
MNVFWNVALCCLVETNRRFRGAYCLSIISNLTYIERRGRVISTPASYSEGPGLKYLPEDQLS